MMNIISCVFCIYLFPMTELPLDDSAAKPGEWDFHPAQRQTLTATPPGFSWRPQKDAAFYELEVKGKAGTHSYTEIGYNVFCPDEPIEPGVYSWRYRYLDEKGRQSKWSGERTFTIKKGAEPFPLPGRTKLLAKIPKEHPRLFVRPEEIPGIRSNVSDEFDELMVRCNKLLENPPPTGEPPRYPKGMEMKSEEWRKMWWGNRTYTEKVLDSAALLAFTGLIAKKTEYKDLARRLLLDAAEWDPRGSTGYRYNDEAGMPYAYHFSRAYTFLHAHLTEEERDRCRKVMRVRGNDMYSHLCPRHLWHPYSSHSNRAWHYLGEVGIAFYEEIPEAADWVVFAANVFRCVYPVWSDKDGGWHEGFCYWQSYINRFTWWAAVMKKALGINAFAKPYFSQAGYYPLYLMPPGQEGGGFGDLCGKITSGASVPLMAAFAAQAQNPHWQWYVDAHGGAPPGKGYVGYIAGLLPAIEQVKPTDLPSSRLFEGTGIAVLNKTILSADDNVQVVFKSSPFGTQSHGYESQNSFLLNVCGERMLVRSGYRDIYGSSHHRDWMWETKSVNSVTVNGKGQKKHSSSATGKIIGFYTGPFFDYAAGEAGPAYGGELDSFVRSVLFIKPDLIIIFDSLYASKPSIFTWHMHSAPPMVKHGDGTVVIEGEKGAALITMLEPREPNFEITDRFDPPPRPRIKLTQWHLTASTTEPTDKAHFISVITAGRKGMLNEPDLTLAGTPHCYELIARSGATEARVILRADNEKGARVEAELRKGDTMIAAFSRCSPGEVKR